MVGELKCVQVGDDEAPVDRNDLKGEATIERVAPVKVSVPAEELYVDSRGYNAIGIQAIEGENDGNNTLVLGQEYSACPNVLVLDHFFDDAEVPADTNQDVRTHLTLVPCSEDFNLQAPISTTVQFLVFNEFEQRFSTSRSIRCFSEIVLSDIDTRAGYDGDAQSIFNVKVQGTLTGQTLIRGVADSATTYGHGLLGIAEEFHSGSFPQRGARWAGVLECFRGPSAWGSDAVGLRVPARSGSGAVGAERSFCHFRNHEGRTVRSGPFLMASVDGLVSADSFRGIRCSPVLRAR